jgi:hypothetical protein
MDSLGYEAQLPTSTLVIELSRYEYYDDHLEYGCPDAKKVAMKRR